LFAELSAFILEEGVFEDVVDLSSAACLCRSCLREYTFVVDDISLVVFFSSAKEMPES
jgi:hypothetical protein